MLLVSRAAFWSFSLTLTSIYAGLNILFFRFLNTNGVRTEEARLFLFLSLLGLIALWALLVFILLRSGQRKAKLLRALKSKKQTSSIRKSLSQALGDIGQEIAHFQKELIEIHLQKSTKIQSQASLVKTLMVATAPSLIVCDIEGKILYHSKPFIERILTRGDVEFKGGIISMFPEIRLRGIVSNLQKNHSPISRKTDLGEVHFYGVWENTGDLAYLICSWDPLSTKFLIPAKEKEAPLIKSTSFWSWVKDSWKKLKK